MIFSKLLNYITIIALLIALHAQPSVLAMNQQKNVDSKPQFRPVQFNNKGPLYNVVPGERPNVTGEGRWVRVPKDVIEDNIDEFNGAIGVWYNSMDVKGYDGSNDIWSPNGKFDQYEVFKENSHQNDTRGRPGEEREEDRAEIPNLQKNNTNCPSFLERFYEFLTGSPAEPGGQIYALIDLLATCAEAPDLFLRNNSDSDKKKIGELCSLLANLAKEARPVIKFANHAPAGLAVFTQHGFILPIRLIAHALETGLSAQHLLSDKPLKAYGATKRTTMLTLIALEIAARMGTLYVACNGSDTTKENLGQCTADSLNLIRLIVKHLPEQAHLEKTTKKGNE